MHRYMLFDCLYYVFLVSIHFFPIEFGVEIYLLSYPAFFWGRGALGTGGRGSCVGKKQALFIWDKCRGNITKT